MIQREISSLIRPNILTLRPYEPGEQPADPDAIKLNTNENPYPPSPLVLERVRSSVDARLRLYPNPTASRLRERLAQLYGYEPEQIIVGNGSDELLAMACRTFVEPCVANKEPNSRQLVQYFAPGYSLYPVLAQIHGAKALAIPLEPDFSLPDPEKLDELGLWNRNAALTYITTPNAPSGVGYSLNQLERICSSLNGVVVLDEAYAEFASTSAIELPRKYPHVLVSRTFSKAYSLCFQRVGYMIGHKQLIQALHKIRDSYNVNGLGQIAAEATLDDLGYYQNNFERIRMVRDHVRAELLKLRFDVFPSQTNFLFARPPIHEAAWWYERLRERKIFIRWFDQPRVKEYLRITVGTPEQMAVLLGAVRELLERPAAKG